MMTHLMKTMKLMTQKKYKLKGGMKLVKKKRAKIIRSVRFNKEKDPENYYREQLRLSL